jgi:centromere-localized protein 2
MPPTESSILSQTLLTPAPLPTILPLPKFTALFPSASRSHPQIPLLYRELQHQRALQIDQVRKNITAEAKLGEKQRREIARTRRRDERGWEGEDMGMEIEGRERMEGLVCIYWVCGDEEADRGR